MDPAALFGLDGVDPNLAFYMILPLGVMLLLFGIFGGRQGRKLMERRVARIKVNHDPAPSVQTVISARRTKASSAIPGLDDLLKRLLPRQDILRLRMARAGMNAAISVYVLASALSAVVGFTVARLVFDIPIMTAGLFAIFCGLGLPHFYISGRIAKRQTRFIDFFPEAIDLMVRGVKAGLPIGESMKTASEETPDPVGEELKRVVDAVRIGRKLDDVLWEASNRLDLQEFKFFTIALSIQTETGGNLAETLSNLSEVLRGRRQLKRKVKALSSEAKASAYIIGSLPFIMTGLIYLVNAEYITGLFMDPRGRVMIGFGLGLIGAGVMVMYKMVKFKI
jgi:tight adherence protein B